MIANYHTHTIRCRHANGSEREMIEAALQAGLQELGFSDHAPQPFKSFYYSRMRMYPDQLSEYAETLRQIREEYRDRIELHIGLEAEYYPDLFPELLEWCRENGIEYLILGQHWLGNEEGEEHVYRPFVDEDRLARYVDQSTEAMRTGLFTYFAHPDLVNFVGDLEIYNQHMRRLIREAKACKVPLEINLHGLSCGCDYPDQLFWELVAEEGAEVVIGRDAHCPEEFLETETEEAVRNMVSRLGLKLLERVPLKKL